LLDDMADAFVELEAQDRAKDLGHAEWLALLLDRQASSRSTRRSESRLRAGRTCATAKPPSRTLATARHADIGRAAKVSTDFARRRDEF
jgi:hypothetical protein